MLHSRRAKSSRVSVYFVRLKRMFSEIVCLDLIFHRFRPVYFSLILKTEKDFNSFTFSSSSCFPLFQGERSALEFGFVILFSYAWCFAYITVAVPFHLRIEIKVQIR